MTVISPPRHIAWSADRLDLADPFQRTWYIRQIIEHGKAEDVAKLDLDEVARLLEELSLPPHLHSLWARFLESRPSIMPQATAIEEAESKLIDERT